MVSASLEQSRIILGFIREALADVEDEYRWLDSGQRLACTHRATGTKLRILSSSGKRAMGLAQFSTIYADEPGSWVVRGGALMWDALRQSLGKRPGQRLLLIGTCAPAEDGSWWPSLLDGGSGPGTHVTVISAPEGEPRDAGTPSGGSTRSFATASPSAKRSFGNATTRAATNRSGPHSRRTDSTGRSRSIGTCSYRPMPGSESRLGMFHQERAGRSSG